MRQQLVRKFGQPLVVKSIFLLQVLELAVPFQVKQQAIYSVAVEPADSPIIGQSKRGENLTPGPHKIQGIGANFIPKNLDLDLVDEVIAIDNQEAIDFARQSATQEAAAAKLAARPENAGKTIVVILPDAGEPSCTLIVFSQDHGATAHIGIFIKQITRAGLLPITRHDLGKPNSTRWRGDITPIARFLTDGCCNQ
ncbi:unnamed protein product [Oppiella nova]|uniref:Uncharacterized protein n=1 Tax=Oppiella nova TaxID=334625 RepID=A0A7R9L7D5_9ACAR|nr:unnamed protein product [Oppiella nova]CAG2156710.1 unnamed protein product [Oppiella nova]